MAALGHEGWVELSKRMRGYDEMPTYIIESMDRTRTLYEVEASSVEEAEDLWANEDPKVRQVFSKTEGDFHTSVKPATKGDSDAE